MMEENVINQFLKSIPAILIAKNIFQMLIIHCDGSE